jgi:membrane protein required for colicin V production
MVMENLNVIDYILLAIFAFSILVGFGRGFVREMVSLITVFAAFIVAIMFAGPIAASFTNSAGVQNAVSQATSVIGVSTAQPVSYVAIGISFGVLFAGTIVIGALIGFFLNIAFQAGMLGVGNRILGAVFGFVRGFIFNIVIVFVVQLTPFVAEAWWQHSQLVNSFQPAVVWLGGIVSPNLTNMKARFEQTIQNVNSSLQNMSK